MDAQDTAILTVQGPGFAWLPWLTALLALAVAVAVFQWLRLRRRLGRQAGLLRAVNRDDHLILQSIPDRVMVLDRELRIVWTNHPHRSGSPSSPAVLEGSPCHVAIAGRQGPCANCPVPVVLRTGQAAEGVVTGLDGALLRIGAGPVRDERGELVGVVQTARDITEKRRLAERLQQSQKMEAVGQLAAGVAHDFNNCLQAVLGYGDLLASLLPAASEAQAYVRAMNRAGQQAREVVRQLLTFSRERKPRTERVDFGAWLPAQADILRRLLGRSITVTVSVAPDLPVVCADIAQVEQVLLNLCTNARDAMPDGGRLELSLASVTLNQRTARQRGAPAAGLYVVLTVADQGEGIPPELQGRIFDPFFTTKDVNCGNGLGLATVYGIVEAHRGFIELESQPHLGSVFRVGWPAGELPPVAGAEPPLTAAEGLAREGSPPQDAAMADAATARVRAGRILVVDEDPSARRLAVSILERAGFAVDEAADSQSALARLLAGEGGYDAVVLEVLLAGANGWSLYRRARRRAPGLKALFCSSHDPELLERELWPDASRLTYLRKPYRAQELVAKVAGLLATQDELPVT